MLLLNKIARLKPKYVILDTKVTLDPRSIIEIRRESVEDEAPVPYGTRAVPDIPSSVSLVGRSLN
jgi:hypothetical protein